VRLTFLEIGPKGGVTWVDYLALLDEDSPAEGITWGRLKSLCLEP
jgi:hypothetical protein